MTGVACEQSAWNLDRTAAALNVERLAAIVDASHPQRGLQQLLIDGQRLVGELLCVGREMESESESTWPLAVSDAYVRGTDFVTSYQSRDDWPYSPQIYWRAEAATPSSRVAGSLSVLVSMQTHLLETWPRIAISAQLACEEAICLDSRGQQQSIPSGNTQDSVFRPTAEWSCLVCRLAGFPLTYVESMVASDFCELRVKSDVDGTVRTNWSLFGEFLEKGVIRRARLQSAFIAREGDLETARSCCETAERKELPLTT